MDEIIESSVERSCDISSLSYDPNYTQIKPGSQTGICWCGKVYDIFYFAVL